MSDLVYIIFGSFLKIKGDRLILITTINFQITIVPIPYKPFIMDFLFLAHKAKN